jgi:hypothetical protein
MVKLIWSDFKAICDSKFMSMQIEADTGAYYLAAYDGPQKYATSIMKETPASADQTEFESTYLASANGRAAKTEVIQSDSDTGGLLLTPKFAPTGWHQQYFETEFETSNSASDSIHEKDWENEDLGYSSLKFYDANGDELTDQNDIDTDCVRTDLLWMPPFDYSIKSGWVAQKAVPATNMYVWALGADLDVAYGGPQSVFAQGGINLTYVDARTRAGLDGVSGTILYYNHPQLGDGAGTNRIRFVVRHEAGVKHRIQAVFELFLE